MNPISMRFVAEFAELLTTALIHFVWQGAVLSLGLVLIVKLFAVRTARHRYLLSVGTLLLMSMAPFLTALLHRNVGSTPGNATDVTSEYSKTVVEDPRSVNVESDPAAAISEPRIYESGGSLSQPVVSASWLNPKIEFYVLLTWLAGVLILSTRLTAAYCMTLWIRRNLTPLAEQFEQRVQSLGRKLGMDARNRVFTCMRVGQAVAVGFVRPIVLIPAAWLTQLTPEMLEAVIAHELAHIRRWDLWVNLAQRVIETLLYYHPAVWWLSNRIRLEREMCCDEIAAECFDRAGYVRLLEAVATISSNDLLLAASINVGSKMNLLTRVRYLLGVAPTEAGPNWWAVVFVVLILPFLATLAHLMTQGSSQPVAMAGDRMHQNNSSTNGDDAPVPTADKDTEELTAWGGEIGGLQFGLGYLPGEKRIYHVGEIVAVIGRVRNPGKDDVNLEYVRDSFNYPPAIFDGNGKRYPMLKTYTNFDHLPIQKTVKAGEELDFYQLTLEIRPADDTDENRMMKIYGAGRFHIQEEHALIGKTWIGAAYSGAEWQHLTSGKLELRVK